MNNRYIQQFKKGSLEMILLCLIGRKETYGYEIITELNNSASVLENGETEQQVIRRLGTPKEFADSTAEQFGIDNASSKKKERYHFYACCAYCCGCCLFDICCYTIRKNTRGRNLTGRRNNKYPD